MLNEHGLEQVYIEWRDCVGKGHYTGPDGDKPSSVLLRGVSWLIEETETDLVVAAYLADDGGFMDMIAIPKSVVAKREKV